MGSKAKWEQKMRIMGWVIWSMLWAWKEIETVRGAPHRRFDDGTKRSKLAVVAITLQLGPNYLVATYMCHMLWSSDCLVDYLMNPFNFNWIHWSENNWDFFFFFIVKKVKLLEFWVISPLINRNWFSFWYLKKLI